MANSGKCLLAAMLAFLFVVTAMASEDFSGRWKISYVVQSGSPDDGLAEGSVASLSEKDATLQGRATLGSRGDGYLIGTCDGSTVRAAITFRHNPSMFVRLTGSCTDGELRGSFTASSNDGGFWQGNFRAIQLTTGAGEVINPDAGADPVSFTPTDVDLLPEPTEYLDPEGNWSAQQESGVKETFVIRYQRNTILMVRKVPMIWQWWL
ncbi:MAG: hypothetical protein ACYDHX_03800 [Methanothrix sp.]